MRLVGRRSRWSCGCAADSLQAVGDVLQADGQAAPDQTTEPVTARAMLEEGASGVSQEKNKKSTREDALRLNRRIAVGC
jgi:hypothetical protein